MTTKKATSWNPVAFIGPKSMCGCGHTGDGMDSQHDDRYSAGHGACKKCTCKQFSWTAWTPEFKKHHNLT